jgi:hypothetical protein
LGDLAGLCARPSDAAAQAFCQGYIIGSGALCLALRRAEAIVGWPAANPQHASDRAINGLWRAAAIGLIRGDVLSTTLTGAAALGRRGLPGRRQ